MNIPATPNAAAIKPINNSGTNEFATSSPPMLAPITLVKNNSARPNTTIERAAHKSARAPPSICLSNMPISPKNIPTVRTTRPILSKTPSGGVIISNRANAIPKPRIAPAANNRPLPAFSILSITPIFSSKKNANPITPMTSIAPNAPLIAGTTRKLVNARTNIKAPIPNATLSIPCPTFSI